MVKRSNLYWKEQYNAGEETTKGEMIHGMPCKVVRHSFLCPVSLSFATFNTFYKSYTQLIWNGDLMSLSVFIVCISNILCLILALSFVDYHKGGYYKIIIAFSVLFTNVKRSYRYFLIKYAIIFLILELSACILPALYMKLILNEIKRVVQGYVSVK